MLFCATQVTGITTELINIIAPGFENCLAALSLRERNRGRSSQQSTVKNHATELEGSLADDTNLFSHHFIDSNKESRIRTTAGFSWAQVNPHNDTNRLGGKKKKSAKGLAAAAPAAANKPS